MTQKKDCGIYIGNPTDPNQKHCDTAVMSVLNCNSDVLVNGSMHVDSISVDHLKIPDGGPCITTYNNGDYENKKLADILKDVADELIDADIVLKGTFAEYYIDYKETTSMTIRYKVETGALLELPKGIKKTTAKRVHTNSISAILSVCRTLMDNEEYLKLQQKIFERI